MLSTFKNTSNYTDISYPTSLADVKSFDINNKLCLNNYNVNDINDVITHQLGYFE